jgi:hypothetical protein
MSARPRLLWVPFLAVTHVRTHLQQRPWLQEREHGREPRPAAPQVAHHVRMGASHPTHVAASPVAARVP